MSVGAAAPLDRIIGKTSLLEVGAFRAPVTHPRFHDSGPIERHIFVFPRTAVSIRHADAEPFVADPTVVTYYNRGDVYAREPVSEHGDQCEWFAVPPAAIASVAEQVGGARGSAPDRPFRFHFGPCDGRSLMRARMVVRYLSLEEDIDELLVEEVMMDVLRRLLRLGQEAREGGALATGPRRSRRDADLAESVKEILADSFHRPLSLAQIAAAVDVSVGHLCRAFKRHTGHTIHRYRDRLRLTQALELICDDEAELLPIALDLGYSSHSHFTAAFQRAFGLSPSAYRRALHAGSLRRHAR